MNCSTLLRSLLDRWSPPEDLFLLILSVIVGAVTGLAAVFFIQLIEAIQHWCYGGFLPSSFPLLSLLLIPAAGALISGPIIAWFASEARGHGVPEVMQALVRQGGRIRARVAVAKIIASAICIGTGGSAGREGPIVQVGSALGSNVGQKLRLSDERIKNLVACGAAAGIAATFNAPIAGVAFAIEVLMCGLQVNIFGNVVISAVSASIVSRIFLGDSPAFAVPDYTLSTPLAIIPYLLLGLIAACAAVGFIRLLSACEDFFEHSSLPRVIQPAVGAILLGVCGCVYGLLPEGVIGSLVTGDGMITPPPFYGGGFIFIEQVLTENHLAMLLLFLLFILKPIATALTLGSGNSGGVFAPSLFIGAMLGGWFGQLVNRFAAPIACEPGSYALVGMTAVFAGAARAPLTAMLIVFEMSNDYALILPLMVAAVTASYFAQYLYPESIYTSKLSKRGIRFDQGKDLDIMQTMLVEEVMKKDVVTVQRDQDFAELYALFQESNLLGFPVLDGDRLWGIVTLQDIRRKLSGNTNPIKGLIVADVATELPLTVSPQEPIWTAIQKMAPRDLARIPVVAQDGSMRLLGVISRSDILRAYDISILRRQREELELSQMALRQTSDMGKVSFFLQQGDFAVNKALYDLHLPPNVNIVWVERKGKTIMPRGDTEFKIGDRIVGRGKRKELPLLEPGFRDGQDSPVG